MLPAIEVSLRLYDTPADFRRAARAAGVTGEGLTKAFAIINRTRNTCVIHLVSPEVSYEPEFYGHEMMHCFFGNFHGRSLVMKYDDFPAE